MKRRLLSTASLLVLVAATALALATSAAAAPTLKGTTTKSAKSSASSITLTRPGTAAAGDVLVGVVNIRAHATRSITAPSGWTLVRRDSTVGGREMSQAVYVHTLGPSDPSTYTWTFSASVAATGAMLAYAGVDDAQPVETSTGKILTNTNRPLASSASASIAESELVALYGVSGWMTVTPPSDLAKRLQVRMSAWGKTTTLAVGDRLLAAAGPSGDKVAKSSIASAVAIGQLVVLRPAGAEPAPVPEPDPAPAPEQDPAPAPEPDPAPAPLQPEPNSSFLSDLTWKSATNAWGPVERDASNGELGAGDGGPIALNGVAYSKGLGVHATSDIRFDLDGTYTTFASDIGVDDEVGSAGSVTFQVWVDGTKVYDSGPMTGASVTRAVRLGVAGAQELRLVVTPAGGAEYDHADWAGAWILPLSTPAPAPAPDTPAPAPSGFAAERFLSLLSGFGSALVQTYGPGSQVSIDPQASVPPARVTVGGGVSSTHYARVRWDDVDIQLGSDFWAFGDFYLPADFYERQESYMRLITLDNYDLEPVSTRRLGFLMYRSDHLPRLMRQREGYEDVEILRLADRLPTGRTFRLAVHLVLSTVDGQALSQVYIDGQLVGQTTKPNVSAGTLPSGLPARFTRAGFGIDGAAEQDTQTVELRMGNIGLSGTRPF